MEENYIDQEVKEVLEHLKDFLATEGMKNGINAEDYRAKDKFDLDRDHEYLDEVSRYFHDGYEMALPSLPDLALPFEELDKGAVLSAVELSSVRDLLSVSEEIYDLLYDKPQYEHLNDDALDLNPLTPLKRDLETDIEPDNSISDLASPKLKEIRVGERALKKQLEDAIETYRSKYSAYLSSDSVVFKGGQEALAVKVSYRGLVKGTVLSYSSTGETAFMVPYAVLDLKGKLESLRTQESGEILKVLADLSQKARKGLSVLRRDYEILLNFDRFFAAVRYGNSYQGSISVRNEEDVLSLQGLFHPLLKGDKVVTNSLTLGGKNPKALVISGPNAGGKSVLIKAVSLSIRMDQLGLLVPCKTSATIPFLDDVYFLGGDNQSVLDNLSTFSSHLLGIKHLTEKATKNSLVVIDEVGEGTSPRDGEALGVAVLKYFERLGSFTILTSHFDGLKVYAAGDPSCLTGAMEFNTAGLEPTYHLLLRTTGKSYGLLLAKQLGLKPEILKDAQDFESARADVDTDALMERLTEQVSENEKIRQQLLNEKHDLDVLSQKRLEAIRALNEERGNIHAKAQEKIDRIVDERVAEINQVWASKGTKATYQEVSKAKGELRKLKDPGEVPMAGKKPAVLLDLKPGDYVEDEDGRKAKVLEVKRKEVLLDLDGLSFRRPIEGLKRSLPPKETKTPSSKVDAVLLDVSSGKLELNIIGLHVDEAMREVVSFLDHARVKRLSVVRIIHGMGSFALKNALWQYLSNHPQFVKSYRLGGEGEGGMGATVITLKV